MLGTVAQCKRRFFIEYIQNFRRHKTDRNERLKQALSKAFVLRDMHRTAGSSFRKMFEHVIAQVFTKAFPEASQEAEHSNATAVLEYYDTVHDYDRSVSFALDKGAPRIGVILEENIGGRITFACNVDRLEYWQGSPVLVVRHFTSSKERGRVEHELSCRLDVMGPLYAASCLLKTAVTRVRFDVIRTKPPAIPKTLLCKTCKGTGLIQNNSDNWPKCGVCHGTGCGGMSTAKCDTTIEIWEATLDSHKNLNRNAVLEQNKTMLDDLRKRGDCFSYSLNVRFGRQQLVNWKTETRAIVADLRTNFVNNHWPRNVYACARNGMLCPYITMCSGKAKEDAAVFHKVEEPYPGLYNYEGLFNAKKTNN
jgi:hypothetical protein